MYTAIASGNASSSGLVNPSVAGPNVPSYGDGVLFVGVVGTSAVGNSAASAVGNMLGVENKF